MTAASWMGELEGIESPQLIEHAALTLYFVCLNPRLSVPYKKPYKMMTVMTMRDHFVQLGLSVGALRDAQAEALAAVGLRGQAATRAMRKSRRDRERHRFTMLAARVGTPRITDEEEAASLPMPTRSRHEGV